VSDKPRLRLVRGSGSEPDEPIDDEQIRLFLQAVSNNMLVPACRDLFDGKWGFALLVFELGVEPTKVRFTSNAVDRRGMIAVLQGMIRTLEALEDRS
jgi:hypothetical protein